MTEPVDSRETESADLSPEIREGRNRLAVSVIIGHAIKHVFNSALPILLPLMKIDKGLSVTQYGALFLSLIHI